MKVAAFHSKQKNATVHHNNNKCNLGNNIDPGNKVRGAGGLPLCSKCVGINERKK